MIADVRTTVACLLVAATAAFALDEPPAPRGTIRLTPGQAEAAGVTYGVAERKNVERIIRTSGRVAYDERRRAEVVVKFAGYVGDLFADYTGRPVRKGEPLFTIYSPELVSAQQEYLLAVRTDRRLASSAREGAADSATSLVRASRERLRLWDLNDRQIRELEERGKASTYVTVYSPMAGIVVRKNVMRGGAVEAGAMLFEIADLSTVWVYADVYEQELAWVKVGQAARITLSYYPDAAFTANVTYVYPELDAKTRTARVRFELANTAEPLLRPEMYATVELRVPLGERLVVPESALLDSGRRQVVFVAAADGQLVPRAVRVGMRTAEDVEIREGVAAGERVVTSASFLVDSESNLQASESMMGMMGAIGMGDWKMESAKPMDMSGGPPPPQSEPQPIAREPGEVKRAGDLSIALTPARVPATVGSSKLRIEVRDSSGKPVSGADVRFTYTMDMPGMAIEQSLAKPAGDGIYEADASFSMAGPWGVVVEVKRPGHDPVRARFTLRVSG
jgi:Cu(I)/Ag(I) efflux system membrane fusion protein